MPRAQVDISTYVQDSAGKNESCKCSTCAATKIYIKEFVCAEFWETHPFSSGSLIQFRRRIAHSPSLDYVKVSYHQPGSVARDCFLTHVRTNTYYVYTFFSSDHNESITEPSSSDRKSSVCERCGGFLDCAHGAPLYERGETHKKEENEPNRDSYVIGVSWAPLIEHVRFLMHIQTFIQHATKQKNVGSVTSSCITSVKCIKEFLNKANK